MTDQIYTKEDIEKLTKRIETLERESMRSNDKLFEIMDILNTMSLINKETAKILKTLIGNKCEAQKIFSVKWRLNDGYVHRK